LKDLGGLLFELSNEDRLNILRELKKNPMRLSRISEKFGSTVPETARNILRLNEEDLIVKDSGGFYHLTPLGDEALELLSGFEFLSKNRSYFMTHSLSKLPHEFSVGLGSLEKCKIVNEVTTTMRNIERVMSEAEEYYWFVADQLLASGLPIAVEAVKRGVAFKKLLLRNASIPDDILAMANNSVFDRAAREKKFESRYADRIEVAIFLSEKEVAALCFPETNGRFDFLGFTSKDEVVHKWSKSLFLHYWDKAKR
jgi:predicted transcriptional regulator